MSQLSVAGQGGGGTGRTPKPKKLAKFKPWVKARNDLNIPEIDDSEEQVISNKQPYATGGFAEIYAIDRQTIVRVVNTKTYSSSQRDPNDILKEVEILKFLVHRDRDERQDPNLPQNRPLHNLLIPHRFAVQDIIRRRTGTILSTNYYMYLPRMEFNLWEATDQNKLDFNTKLDITFKLFNAVAYLHDAGILHRDIKPENILLSGIKDRKGPDRPDYVKLGDFDFASGINDETMLSKELCTDHYGSSRVTAYSYLRALGPCMRWNQKELNSILDIIKRRFVSISYRADKRDDVESLLYSMIFVLFTTDSGRNPIPHLTNYKEDLVVDHKLRAEGRLSDDYEEKLSLAIRDEAKDERQAKSLARFFCHAIEDDNRERRGDVKAYLGLLKDVFNSKEKTSGKKPSTTEVLEATTADIVRSESAKTSPPNQAIEVQDPNNVETAKESPIIHQPVSTGLLEVTAEADTTTTSSPEPIQQDVMAIPVQEPSSEVATAAESVSTNAVTSASNTLTEELKTLFKTTNSQPLEGGDLDTRTCMVANSLNCTHILFHLNLESLSTELKKRYMITLFEALKRDAGEKASKHECKVVSTLAEMGISFTGFNNDDSKLLSAKAKEFNCLSLYEKLS